MCGICGIFGEGDPDGQLLERMAASIRHRGPDHTGYLVESPASLAMTRLSIIDLEGGTQPMHSPDGRVSMVFNGEIYNFRDLRKAIEPHIAFRSRSDTEVILNGYLLWGTDVFRRLNGMFAVALWDRADQVLYLVRDPMGIKPLYYLKQGARTFFSSEMKTFTRLRLANRANPAAIAQFLSACYVFHPETALEGVGQVEPGTWHELRVGQETKVRTFRIPGQGNAGSALSPDAAQEQVSEALHAAIVRQTVADVPYGLLLSSGIDSMALVAALHRQRMTDHLRTYTLFFPDDDGFSEDRPVRKVAEQLGFDSTFLPFQAKDLLQNWEAICSTFDNLDLLPTAALIFMLSREAARDRRLVLAGNGGDELFLGYPTYAATQWVRRLKGLSPLLKTVLPALGALCPTSSNYLTLSEKVRRFCQGFSSDPAIAHARWRHVFTLDELGKLLSPDFTTVALDSHYTPQTRFHAEAATLGYTESTADQWMDLRTWMVDSGLMMWDKAGMASSLEIRVPVIDLDLVDLVMSLPPQIRSGGRPGSKSLLRKIVARDLPPSIASLPKQGFQLPLDRWMRGELRELFRSMTFSLPAAAFDHAYIERLWSDFDAGRGDHALKLWALGALAGWQQQHQIDLC